MGCQQSSVRMAPRGPNVAGAAGLSPLIPAVPSGSWYAQELEEVSRMTFTQFHTMQRGNVVFSKTCVPVGSSELEGLPNQAPPLAGEVVIGKDALYGMAYLHDTALFMEHQWRLRVAHYKSTCSPTFDAKAFGVPSTDEEKARLWDLKKTVYERPCCDTYVGVKVYVNGELVPDLFPTRTSLPQCTSTFESSEVFNNWRCIPFVLVGYVYSPLLSTVSIYRSLSLSFADYMLKRYRVDCEAGTTVRPGGGLENSGNNDEGERCEKTLEQRGLDRNDMEHHEEVRDACERIEENVGQPEGASYDDITAGEVHEGVAEEAVEPVAEEGDNGTVEQCAWNGQTYNVTVEIVYGCRMEMKFCTEPIAKGSVDVVMTQQSEAALSKYKASLQQVSQRCGDCHEQVVPIDPLALKGKQSSTWTCLFCQSQLLFVCTICGAQLCGKSTCVWKPFTGYPLGCSLHKAQD